MEYILFTIGYLLFFFPIFILICGVDNIKIDGGIFFFIFQVVGLYCVFSSLFVHMAMMYLGIFLFAIPVILPGIFFETKGIFSSSTSGTLFIHQLLGLFLMVTMKGFCFQAV